MKYFAFAVALLLIAGIALAADVDGKWTGTIPGMDIPVAYTFKADGATLTGTSSGPNDTTVPIKNGKIDGNNISFSVTFDMGGQEMKLDYKGVVSADQIKLSFDMMGQTTEILVKKAK
ncbi:MAG: hypothetical protein ABSC60_07790 [Acidobacteriota bacterium]|jgi:hypothetical protein